MSQATVSLKPHHTFKLDVNSLKVVEAQDLAQLMAAVNLAQSLELPYVIIGMGSNSIFCDDYHGIVIVNKITGYKIVELADSYQLTVNSGMNWDQLVRELNAQQIHGLENMVSIPGTIGAGVVGNVGAYGLEMRNFITSITAIDLINKTSHQFKPEECNFAYRYSIFKEPEYANFYIAQVTLELSKKWQANLNHAALEKLTGDITADQILETVAATRAARVPDFKIVGNVGSFFVNPFIDQQLFTKLIAQYPNLAYWATDDANSYKISAAWLIESCNLKGYRIGEVEISPIHALVLTNLNDAKLADLTQMIYQILTQVKEKFAIDLQTEPRFYAVDREVKGSPYILSLYE